MGDLRVCAVIYALVLGSDIARIQVRNIVLQKKEIATVVTSLVLMIKRSDIVNSI